MSFSFHIKISLLQYVSITGARYIQNVFSNSIMIDKILTTHTKINGQVETSASYSKCKTYRYSLTKDWNKKGKRLLFILLNPSTATEKQNDPTIERCERRSRLMNYGAFRVCNLFAFRTKSPKIMKNQRSQNVWHMKPAKENLEFAEPCAVNHESSILRLSCFYDHTFIELES